MKKNELKGRDRELIHYLISREPDALWADRKELSSHQLKRLLFLADCYSMRRHGKQLTNSEWTADCYGPYSEWLDRILREDESLVRVDYTCNKWGHPKHYYTFKKGQGYSPGSYTTETDKLIIDDVIIKTECMDWSELREHLYELVRDEKSVQFVTKSKPTETPSNDGLIAKFKRFFS